MKLLWILCCFYLVVKTTESYSLNNERLNSISAGLSIYRKFAPKSENFVFSPISLRTIYSILYQSSTGYTKYMIRKLLFRRSKSSKDSKYLEIQPIYIQKVLNSSSVSSVNKIYLKAGYNLQKQFQHVVQSFRANVELIDFNESKRAANKINYWIGNMTHGLIRHAIDPASITAQTALIVINALNFKANWKVSYGKSNVAPRIFHDEQHSTHQIDFIISKGFYKISKLPRQGFQVLELPFELKTKFSFWLILPDANHTIKSILPHIKSKTIKRINRHFVEQYTKIQFPIFNIHTKLDGKKISPAMFQYPEYNMLTKSPPLSLNLLKQETNFRVNTNGTEAATVTHAHMGLRSVRHQLVQYFTADRPFLFAVIRNGIRDPIYFGHYVKPKVV